MIPISDYPSPPGKPVVTIVLIVVNIAIYLLVTLPLGAQPARVSPPTISPCSGGDSGRRTRAS